MSQNLRVVQILLVEDNETDILILREALRETRVRNELIVVKDGEEAMKFLRRQAPHSAAQRPDLVLLDLNLPGKSGMEVLAEVKTDEHLRLIPVVVLTTSGADQDIVKAYGRYANSYVTKPLDLDAFNRVLFSLEDYWLSVVTLPKRTA